MEFTFCEAARTFKAALRRAATLVAGHEGRWPSLSDLAQPDLSISSYIASTTCWLSSEHSAVLPSQELEIMERPRSLYEPLPQGNYLRILLLHPGRFDHEISCDLISKSLEQSDDEYEAISYVWGNPDDTVDIICNGRSVSITVNLRDALRRFRDEKTARRLWADALCINQEDTQEKGHQVQRMGEIYRNAQTVLVWLGRASEGIAEECFAAIRRTNTYLDSLFVENGNSYFGMSQMTPPFPIPVDKSTWQKVAALLKLPWFKRVWTIQECALAKKCRMFWGKCHIDCEDVFELSLWCWRYGYLAQVLSKHGLYHLSNLFALYSDIHSQYRGIVSWQNSRPGLVARLEERRNHSFVHVLNQVDRLKAEDPRDYIYAFLGCPISQTKDRNRLMEPDYTLTVDDVYSAAAIALLKRTNEGALVLTAVRHPSRQHLVQTKQPTWVPRWHIVRSYNTIGNVISTFRAGSSTAEFRAAVHDDRSLAVPGFQFDTVAWKSDTIQVDKFALSSVLQEPGMQNAEQPYVDVLRDEVSKAAQELQLQVRYDRFIFAITKQWGQSSLDSDDLAHHRELFSSYLLRVHSQALGSLDWSIENEVVSEVHGASLVAQYLAYSWGLSVILTKEGRIGLAPGDIAEVGDACCIFLGVQTPFVLAPMDNNRYRLVGECFIQGVMDGELLGEHEPHDIVIE